MKPTATIIGSGFSSLSAATSLADKGFDVTIIEKNESAGGRARKFEHDGFMFDMGPSWYWMPDVFDKYFARFGKKTSDYYTLKRLDPSYRVFFEDEYVDMPASFQGLIDLFECLAVNSLSPFVFRPFQSSERKEQFFYMVGLILLLIHQLFVQSPL